MKILLTIVLMSLMVLGMPTNAFAHSVETDYAMLAQSQLDIAVKFSTGEPFELALVQVYSPKDATKPWLESKTDRNGHFKFLPDQTLSGDWTVKIGQMNSDHGDILTVPVSAQGIDANRISQRVDTPTRPPVGWLGFVVFSSVIGTQLVRSQRQSGLLSTLQRSLQGIRHKRRP